jgi:hypothetical protein
MEIWTKQHIFSNIYLQLVSTSLSYPCAYVRLAKYTLHMSWGYTREREKEDGDSLTLVYFLLSCYFIINFCPQSHCKCCCFCLECSFLSFSSITKLVKYIPSVSHTKVNFLGEAFLDSRGSVVILCISPHIFLYFAFITPITRFFFRVFFLQG